MAANYDQWGLIIQARNHGAQLGLCAAGNAMSRGLPRLPLGRWSSWCLWPATGRRKSRWEDWVRGDENSYIGRIKQCIIFLDFPLKKHIPKQQVVGRISEPSTVGKISSSSNWNLSVPCYTLIYVNLPRETRPTESHRMDPKCDTMKRPTGSESCHEGRHFFRRTTMDKPS